MEQQAINYADGDVIAFERFGEIYQADAKEGAWRVQQKHMSMNMVVLTVCYKGTINVRLNGRDFEVTPGQGLVCLPSAIIERLMVSPDVHLRGFGFSVTAMEIMFHTNQETWREALSMSERPLVKLDEIQLKVTEHLYEIIHLGNQKKSCRYFRSMIRSLLQSFLYLLADVISQAPDDGKLVASPREQQFKQFVQLLWSSGGRMRTVSYYAEQMCITPKYLSVIVREMSGKTPMQMIHKYTANMIAQRLRTTNMTVKEIARELNFSNDSFFGRYVKQHLGYPPKEYRERMNAHSEGSEQ